MKPWSTFLTPVLVGAAVALTGCSDQINSIIASYPQTSAFLGGRPSPSPFVLNVGNITGFVYGASGKSQPIRTAFVTTGSVNCYAGNPDADHAVDAADELTGDNATAKHLTVMHVFKESPTAVAAERVIRTKVPRENPDDDADTNARRGYFYLRPGEFFLEGVPEGITKLTASFGNVQSAANPVTVYPNQLVTGVSMNLYIPEPVTTEGNAPHVVEWTGLSPETGISVQTDTKTTDTTAGPQTTVSITYKPDPPDVSITLKAPPGSSGAVIKGVDITYTFNTSGRQAQGLPNQQIGPIRVPIPPVVVAPAQDIAFGPPSVIRLPIGSASLKQVFSNPDSTQQPGLIVASMSFVDDAGFPVQDKSFANLQVSAVLRSL